MSRSRSRGAGPNADAERTGQSWDPDVYARNARFVADHGMPVLDLLAPQSHERILDLGCGDGALTEKLAALCHSVVGVDGSPEQIAAARERGLDAHVVDGHALDYDAEFHAVFSNAALHWMREPDTVIAGVWRALKPGGRFVGEKGGAGNVTAIVAAVESAMRRRGVDPEPLNPWYFATVDEYRERLETSGFVVSTIQLIPRPTPLPADIVGWLDTFAGSFLSVLPEGDREPAKNEIAEELGPKLRKPDGVWEADYVRLRFAATKPPE